MTDDHAREELEHDTAYQEADETERGYMEAEIAHSQPALPRPAASHIERTPDGHIVKSRDVEALTYNIDYNAPQLETTGAEAAQDLGEAQTPPAAPSPEHLEAQLQDENLEEELQDGMMSEDELIDMAPARELFDDPDAIDDDA